MLLLTASYISGNPPHFILLQHLRHQVPGLSAMDSETFFKVAAQVTSVLFVVCVVLFFVLIDLHQRSIFSRFRLITMALRGSVHALWIVHGLLSTTGILLIALPLALCLPVDGGLLDATQCHMQQVPHGAIRALMVVMAIGVLVLDYTFCGWVATAGLGAYNLSTQVHPLNHLIHARVRIIVPVVFVAAPGSTSFCLTMAAISVTLIGYTSFTQPYTRVAHCMPPVLSWAVVFAVSVARLHPGLPTAGHTVGHSPRAPYVINFGYSWKGFDVMATQITSDNVREAIIVVYTTIIAATLGCYLTYARYRLLNIGYGRAARDTAVHRLVAYRRVVLLARLPFQLPGACWVSLSRRVSRSVLHVHHTSHRRHESGTGRFGLADRLLWTEQVFHGPPYAVYRALYHDDDEPLRLWHLTPAEYTEPPCGDLVSPETARYYIKVWLLASDPAVSTYFLGVGKAHTSAQVAQMHAAGIMMVGQQVFRPRIRDRPVAAAPMVRVAAAEDDRQSAEARSCRTVGELGRMLANGEQVGPFPAPKEDVLSQNRQLSHAKDEDTLQAACHNPVCLLDCFTRVLGRDFGFRSEKRLFCWIDDIKLFAVSRAVFDFSPWNYLVSLMMSILWPHSTLLQLHYIGLVRVFSMPALTGAATHWTEIPEAVTAAVEGLNLTSAAGAPMHSEMLRARLIALQHRAVRSTGGLTCPHIGVEMERLKRRVAQAQADMVHLTAELLDGQLTLIRMIVAAPGMHYVTPVTPQPVGRRIGAGADEDASPPMTPQTMIAHLGLERSELVGSVLAIQGRVITQHQRTLSAAMSMYRDLMDLDARFTDVMRHSESVPLLVTYRSFLITACIEPFLATRVSARIFNVSQQGAVYDGSAFSTPDPGEKAIDIDAIRNARPLVFSYKGRDIVISTKAWMAQALVPQSPAVDPSRLSHVGPAPPRPGPGEERNMDAIDPLDVAHTGLPSSAAARRNVARIANMASGAYRGCLPHMRRPSTGKWAALLACSVLLTLAVPLGYLGWGMLTHISLSRRMHRELHSAAAFGDLPITLWRQFAATAAYPSLDIGATVDGTYAAFMARHGGLTASSIFGVDPFPTNMDMPGPARVAPLKYDVQYSASALGGWAGAEVTIGLDGSLTRVETVIQHAFSAARAIEAAIRDPASRPCIVDGITSTIVDDDCAELLTTLRGAMPTEFWRLAAALDLVLERSIINGRQAAAYVANTAPYLTIVSIMIGTALPVMFLQVRADRLTYAINASLKDVRLSRTPHIISKLLQTVEDSGTGRVLSSSRLAQVLSTALDALSDPRLECIRPGDDAALATSVADLAARMARRTVSLAPTPPPAPVVGEVGTEAQTWPFIRSTMQGAMNLSSTVFCVSNKPLTPSRMGCLFVLLGVVAVAMLGIHTEIATQNLPRATEAILPAVTEVQNAAATLVHTFQGLHRVALEATNVDIDPTAAASTYLGLWALWADALRSVQVSSFLMAGMYHVDQPTAQVLAYKFVSDVPDVNLDGAEHVQYLANLTNDLIHMQRQALGLWSDQVVWQPTQLPPHPGDWTYNATHPAPPTLPLPADTAAEDRARAAHALLSCPAYLARLEDASDTIADLVDDWAHWTASNLRAPRAAYRVLTLTAICVLAVMVFCGAPLLAVVALQLHGVRCYRAHQESRLLSSDPERPVCCPYHFTTVFVRRSALEAFHYWAKLWRADGGTGDHGATPVPRPRSIRTVLQALHPAAAIPLVVLLALIITAFGVTYHRATNLFGVEDLLAEIQQPPVTAPADIAAQYVTTGRQSLLIDIGGGGAACTGAVGDVLAVVDIAAASFGHAHLIDPAACPAGPEIDPTRAALLALAADPATPAPDARRHMLTLLLAHPRSSPPEAITVLEGMGNVSTTLSTIFIPLLHITLVQRAVSLLLDVFRVNSASGRARLPFKGAFTVPAAARSVRPRLSLYSGLMALSAAYLGVGMLTVSHFAVYPNVHYVAAAHNAVQVGVAEALHGIGTPTNYRTVESLEIASRVAADLDGLRDKFCVGVTVNEDLWTPQPCTGPTLVAHEEFIDALKSNTLRVSRNKDHAALLAIVSAAETFTGQLLDLADDAIARNITFIVWTRVLFGAVTVVLGLLVGWLVVHLIRPVIINLSFLQNLSGFLRDFVLTLNEDSLGPHDTTWGAQRSGMVSRADTAQSPEAAMAQSQTSEGSPTTDTQSIATIHSPSRRQRSPLADHLAVTGGGSSTETSPIVGLAQVDRPEGSDPDTSGSETSISSIGEDDMPLYNAMRLYHL